MHFILHEVFIICCLLRSIVLPLNCFNLPQKQTWSTTFHGWSEKGQHWWTHKSIASYLLPTQSINVHCSSQINPVPIMINTRAIWKHTWMWMWCPFKKVQSCLTYDSRSSHWFQYFTLSLVSLEFRIVLSGDIQWPLWVVSNVSSSHCHLRLTDL